MIYLDHGATSFVKPPQVEGAMVRALHRCANPGRGGYRQSMEAARTVYRCREQAGRLFSCQPEQVVFTANCTQGLNTAIFSLFSPGDRVVISGFEHNAVLRPLYALGAEVIVAGRKLFDWEDTLSAFEKALKQGVEGAVFTHVSNVFGYMLPVEQLSSLCREYGVPFVIDCAQSAGMLPIDFRALGADAIAMPGHKGLLGPQGTGMLICKERMKPLCYGGTGGDSQNRQMPQFLPEGMEAGTLNVPGIAGLSEGLGYLIHRGVADVGRQAALQCEICAKGLSSLGYRVFAGEHQLSTVSFVPNTDCEVFAEALSGKGIAVRAGLHCAPLAHESAGTLQTGTVRISFGHDARLFQTKSLLKAVQQIL